MSVAARRSRQSTGRSPWLEWLAGQFNPLHATGRLPAALVVLLTGVLLGAFLFSDEFKIDTVRVEGAEFSDVEAVIEVSGTLGQSAFRARPDDVAARVEALPAVEHASVEIQYPGQVAIVVQEREPVIAITNGHEQALISEGGTAISSVDLVGLPELSVEGTNSLEDVEVTAELVAAVRAIDALFGDAARIVWTQDIGLNLELTGDRLILIGSPDQIDAKLTVLSAVEHQVDASWSQLDLREPSRPAYR